jgi:DNA-binding CsgD family transcriptional regulator
MCDVCGNVPDWITSAPAEKPGTKKKRRRKTAAEPPPREAPKPAVRPETQPAPRPVIPPPAPPSVFPQPAARPPAFPPPREEVVTFEADPDDGLLQLLKNWRRRTAERASVPAYIILSDAALADLSRKRPTNLRELLGVTGIGERKAEQCGSEIFATIEAHRKGVRAAAAQVAQISPAEETMRLLAAGKSFEEIAQIRGRQPATVVNMIADLVEKGLLEYRVDWVGEESHRLIEAVVRRLGSQWLKPLREALPPDIGYDQIRLVVAYVRRQGQRG